MKHSLATCAMVVALSLTAPVGFTQEADEGPDEFPFESIPASDPAELQQIAGLSDAELVSRLFNRAAPNQPPGLDRFYPPGTRVFPMSHGFAGPRDACLKDRVPAACRLHVQDLYKINANRRSPPGIANSPFGRAP